MATTAASLVFYIVLVYKIPSFGCSEGNSIFIKDECLSRTMPYPDQKAHMAHCISSCLGLDNEATVAQKCFYHPNNGSLLIKNPRKVEKDKNCPEIDCNSPTALQMKSGFSLVFPSTRIANQKKLCGRRLYFSLTENPYVRGFHMCPCYLEKMQLWSADSVEKIKCVLEKLPDSQKQKGMLLTAGYRTSTSQLSWCNASKNKTGFSEISTYLERTSRMSQEICLILTFTPFRKGESPPDNFVLKEVPCGEGIFFIVCESEDPL